MMLTVICSIFIFGVLIGVPVAFAMGLAGTAWIIFFEGLDPTILARRIYHSLSSFHLLSIPLFVMIGALAERCGMLPDLVHWLQLVFGWVRGGRAYISVVASTVFSGVSGTAVSDIASLGRIEIEMLRQANYPPAYAAALVATCAILAPIIPPSIAMIIYALAAGNVSIGGLFMGGVFPGLALSGGLMVMSWYKARHGEYGILSAFPSWRALLRETVRVIPLMVLPLIIVGGIIFGVFTVTESAAIGVVYTLFIGVVLKRNLTIRDLFESVIYAAVVSAVVGMLIAAGAIVSWILTRNQVTQQLADFLTGITTDPMVFMAIVAVALLLLGMLMDATAIILALTPLLAPVARRYGIDDIQFGVFFVLCCMVGLIHPPVGVIIAMVSTVAKVPLESVTKEILPFVGLCVFVIGLLIVFPWLTLWLPRSFGF
jgi:tripartite ATP-independent transporter DctM subunit